MNQQKDKKPRERGKEHGFREKRVKDNGGLSVLDQIWGIFMSPNSLFNSLHYTNSVGKVS